jgi:hypothetical protein
MEIQRVEERKKNEERLRNEKITDKWFKEQGNTNSVYSITGLRLQSRIPMKIKKKQMVGARQIQPNPSRLQGEQHHLGLGRGIEAFHRFLAL